MKEKLNIAININKANILKTFSNTRFKILFDTLMTIMFILLMDVFFTGVLLHEMIGIAVSLFFILHKGINFKWIRTVSGRIFSKISDWIFEMYNKRIISLLKHTHAPACALEPAHALASFPMPASAPGKSLSFKIKAMYAVDAFLLGGVTAILVTGIGISQEIFGLWDNNSNLIIWSAVHHSAAYISLILVSVHIGLHWKMIMQAFRKMFGVDTASKVRTFAARAAAFVLVLTGIRAAYALNFTELVTEPLRTGDGNLNSSGEEIKSYGGAEINEGGYLVASSDNDGSLAIVASAASTSVTAANTSSSYTVRIGESLEQFLSRLICTACPKRCILLYPKCVKGELQKSKATTSYYQQIEQVASASAAAETTKPQVASASAESSPSSPSATVSSASSISSSSSAVQALPDSSAEAVISGDSQEASPYEASSKPGKGHNRGNSSVAASSAVVDSSAVDSTVMDGIMADKAAADGNTPAETPVIPDQSYIASVDEYSDGSQYEQEAETNPFTDFVPIMGLFIAGTHYTVSIPEKFRIKKKKVGNKS